MNKPTDGRPYLNSPAPTPRNCSNCFHRRTDDLFDKDSGFDRCLLTGYYCSVSRQRPSEPCDENLSGWAPIPAKPPPGPRRSLRGWLLDTFWRV